MIDRRHVYIMARTSDDRAEILVSRKMLDARGVEMKLHDLFGDARVEMREGLNPSYFKHHIKIGISKNPKQRRVSISKNIFKSGRTEWFALNEIELEVLRYWLWYYSIRWKLRLFFIILLIFLIIGIQK